MLNHPEIDPDRMKKWKENVLPTPSAERLKNMGSSEATCSARNTVTVGCVREMISDMPDDAEVIVMGVPNMKVLCLQSYDGDLEIYPIYPQNAEVSHGANNK